jgi:hypothetical protein
MTHRAASKTEGSIQMIKRSSLLAAAMAASLSVLSACTAEPPQPIQTMPRRAETGAPLPPMGSGPVVTDGAGNAVASERRGAPLAPGSGPVTTGGAHDVTTQERRGAPLPPTAVQPLGTSGSTMAP